MTQRMVGSVARALSLLEELRDSEEGLGVNELSRRSASTRRPDRGCSPRFESHGLVQRDATARPYRLGLALVTLADRVLSRLDLQALARPVLVELMEGTGETATLSLPGEREAMTVDSPLAGRRVVSMARLERPELFCHATAVGKVMLAYGGTGSRASAT